MTPKRKSLEIISITGLFPYFPPLLLPSSLSLSLHVQCCVCSDVIIVLHTCLSPLLSVSVLTGLVGSHLPISTTPSGPGPAQIHPNTGTGLVKLTVLSGCLTDLPTPTPATAQLALLHCWWWCSSWWCHRQVDERKRWLFPDQGCSGSSTLAQADASPNHSSRVKLSYPQSEP